MINRLKSISINDDISFIYNNDVMRQCFGSSRTDEYGQYAVQATEDGCEVWFPKERIQKDGQWVAGTNAVNWKNHIESDGLVIISELNPGELPKDSSDEGPKPILHWQPMYTFWKVFNEPYRYVGTFLVDVNSSKPRKQVFRRINTKIDLSDWYNNINISGLSHEAREKNAYQLTYIKQKYKRHYEYVNEFILNRDDDDENIYNRAVEEINSLYPIGKLNSIDIKEYINYVVTKILNVFGEDYSELTGVVENNPYLIVELLLSAFADQVDPVYERTKHHNEAIRESELGVRFAGKLMALYRRQHYIYSLDEETVDFYLSKLLIDIPKGADLTEKHSLLCFWKQCHEEMNNWTPFTYVKFLTFVFGRTPNMSITNASFNAASYINAERLDKAINWFMNYGVNQSLDSDLHFSDGWINAEEGYKEELFSIAHDSLEIESWDKDMIGTGLILENVIKALNAKNNNIVNYHTKTSFRERAETDIAKSERILFHLFKDENPGMSFEEACEFWGRNYSELSYLMTSRDCSKYVPVKTTFHINRFMKLGISCDCFKSCNWENYQFYNSINMEIQQQLEERFGMPISLLDAHSFVWSLHHADEDFSYETDSNIEEFIKNEEPYTSIVIKGDKEGRIVEHYVTKYERSPQNRKEAIRIHGYICAVCGFDFEKQYGSIGKDFIEVHHIKPLYTLNEEVSINPATDLVCLCANCHRMIHRKKGGIYTVDELKDYVEHSNNIEI